MLSAPDGGYKPNFANLFIASSKVKLQIRNMLISKYHSSLWQVYNAIPHFKYGIPPRLLEGMLKQLISFVTLINQPGCEAWYIGDRQLYLDLYRLIRYIWDAYWLLGFF
jgi:hypothetical protein